MKHVLIVSFIFLNFALIAQDNSQFNFWISSLDKAAYRRDTYKITKDSIIIKQGPYDFIYFAKDYDADRIVFAKKIDSIKGNEIGILVDKIKSDSIKTLYDNLCIIDGMIMHFHFEWPDKTKSTTISNYYLPEVEPLINYINKLFPEKYKLPYDKESLKELMKNCSKDRILD
jgi:hypothetical protein